MFESFQSLLTLKTLGGVAAIGAIAASWGHIKNIFGYLTNIFIITISFETNMPEAVYTFLWGKCKRVSLGNRSYGSINTYINKKDSTEYVAYESLGAISNIASIFFYGMKPIFFLSTQTPGSRPAFSNTKKSISFFRGTFDPDEFIIMCNQYFNKIEFDINFNRRFKIKRIEGKGTNNSTQGSPQLDYDEPDEYDSYFFTKRESTQYRILEWERGDLGLKTFCEGSPVGLLFYPETITEVLKEIRRWKESKQWYRDRYIPWKKGCIFQGLPGTGKTSAARAIGEDLDMPLFVFDLSTMDNSTFVKEWNLALMCAPVIMLIEDIDNTFVGRENIVKRSKEKDTLTFDCLLNCIDGVDRAEGVLTIITTNDIGKVDPAIGKIGEFGATRPGRINTIIEFPLMNLKCRFGLARRILLEETEEEITNIVNRGNGMTPDQFQNLCAKCALDKYWSKKESLKIGDQNETN